MRRSKSGRRRDGPNGRIPFYPMLCYVGLSDERGGVAVLTDSSREYEIVGKSRDTIAVTLFRSVGVLGKEALWRRPARTSGSKSESPDGQIVGKIRLHRPLTTHPGTTKQGEVAQRAKRFFTPLCTDHKTPLDAIKLHPPAVTAPKEYSLLAQSDE